MLKNKKYLYGARNVLIPSSVNYGDFMLQKLFSYKDNVALVNANTNETMTHGEIAQQALNLAVSLYRLGVRKGDMMAVISENRMEYLSTVIGIACVGATATLINPFYRKGKLSNFCKGLPFDGPVEYIAGPMMSVGPWFHVMGQVGSSVFLTMGKQIVYMQKFDINLYLKAIEIYKPSLLLIAPAILVAALKCEKQYDLSSVRRIISGSAPLSVDLIKSIATKLPNLEGIICGYGLTETTLAIVIGRFDNPKLVNNATAGMVLPNTIIKIVGPNQELLGPYERGEICTKGALNMKGYVGGSTESAFDDEGFFKTGDKGYYDEEGNLFVLDRIKELIKYKGNQVIPAELEALLLQHEAVRDAAVVGIPDEEAGELPVAFVALQPGMSATEKEIQDFVAERISKTKHLRGGVRFVAEIPKNGTGKTWRHKLKKAAIEGNQN